MLFIGIRGKAAINSDNRISNAILRKELSCKNSSYFGIRREGTISFYNFKSYWKFILYSILSI